MNLSWATVLFDWNNKMTQNGIVISYGYGPRTYEEWPKYDLPELPEGWIYSGYEGVLDSQPEWNVCNAYWHGPAESTKKAMEVLNTLYKRYKGERFLDRFEMNSFGLTHICNLANRGILCF